MGWRFRKRIKLAPGLHVNLGMKGLSFTVGGAPVSMNFGRRGRRTTVSLPGTGLSFVATPERTAPSEPVETPPARVDQSAPANSFGGFVLKTMARLALVVITILVIAAILKPN